MALVDEIDDQKRTRGANWPLSLLTSANNIEIDAPNCGMTGAGNWVSYPPDVCISHKTRPAGIDLPSDVRHEAY